MPLVRGQLTAQQASAASQGMSPERAAEIYIRYGGRSASYAGLEPTWSGRIGGRTRGCGRRPGQPHRHARASLGQ